jgi:hypothetical protein
MVRDRAGMSGRAELNRKKWAESDKISGFKVVVRIKSKPSHIRIKPISPAQSTKTGDLRVVSIESARANLPKFSGRWDQRIATVDFDIEVKHIRGMAKERQRKISRYFNGETGGYQGHHTKRVQYNREYEFSIVLPIADFPNLRKPMMVQGTINLSAIRFERHVRELIKISDSGEVRVQFARQVGESLKISESVHVRVHDAKGREVTPK